LDLFEHRLEVMQRDLEMLIHISVYRDEILIRIKLFDWAMIATINDLQE